MSQTPIADALQQSYLDRVADGVSYDELYALRMDAIAKVAELETQLAVVKRTLFNMDEHSVMMSALQLAESAVNVVDVWKERAMLLQNEVGRLRAIVASKRYD